MKEIFLISITISMVCVGIRIITSPGMIFEFLRKPYDDLIKELKEANRLLENKKAWVERHQIHLSNLRLGKEAYPNKGYMHDRDETGAARLTDIEMTDLEKKDYLISGYNTLSDELNAIKDISEEKKVIVRVVNLLKPIVGCVACMASVWTLLLFVPVSYVVYGDGGTFVEPLRFAFIPVCMLISVVFNSMIMSLYEFLNRKPVVNKEEPCKDCK